MEKLTQSIFGLGVLLTAVAWGGGQVGAQDSVTFTSWGGSYQKAIRKAFLNPAEKKLGVVVKEATTGGLPDIRAQVASGNPSWDVVELSSRMCAAAKKEGLVEPLDYNVIDASALDKSLVDSHWVGNIHWGTVIAWNTKKYGDKGPKNWADFFDTKKFPGSRSVYHRPQHLFEGAMMAAGRSLDAVYPIDVDKAFEMMALIRDDIRVYYKSGAQAAQLLKDGEVDMISIWNGRVSNAIKDGANANYTFNQQVQDFDCLIVLKGAKNKELAMKLINEFLVPENQAELPLHINYAPSNPKAYAVPDKITPKIAEGLPSSPQNRGKAILFNPTWWVEHGADVVERFDEFVQN